MIVESAFLKIPEILLTHDDPDSLYEANITNLFTNGVILELNARNIDNPLTKIHMEKRYDSKINSRCDVFLDFSSFINDSIFTGYSIKSKSWIEAKYFGGINRNKGSETKSENAGHIIYDIFRLTYLCHLAGNEADSKYCIFIFNDLPSKYLAFKRQNGETRSWINSMLQSGIVKLHFNLSDEPNCIQKIFSESKSLSMNITLRNLSFEPIENSFKKSLFYGYLSQIVGYEIIINDKIYRSQK